jgi:hypothetical protein
MKNLKLITLMLSAALVLSAQARAHDGDISSDPNAGDQAGVAVPLVDGDINNDGFVDVADLALVLEQWGDYQGSRKTADIFPAAGDSTVDFWDMYTVLSNWGMSSAF